jgi:hypothetical protein
MIHQLRTVFLIGLTKIISLFDNQLIREEYCKRSIYIEIIYASFSPFQLEKDDKEGGLIIDE